MMHEILRTMHEQVWPAVELYQLGAITRDELLNAINEVRVIHKFPTLNSLPPEFVLTVHETLNADAIQRIREAFSKTGLSGIVLEKITLSEIRRS
jgi:hypothetical protein